MEQSSKYILIGATVLVAFIAILAKPEAQQDVALGGITFDVNDTITPEQIQLAMDYVGSIQENEKLLNGRYKFIGEHGLYENVEVHFYEGPQGDGYQVILHSKTTERITSTTTGKKVNVVTDNTMSRATGPEASSKTWDWTEPDITY